MVKEKPDPVQELKKIAGAERIIHGFGSLGHNLLNAIVLILELPSGMRMAEEKRLFPEIPKLFGAKGSSPDLEKLTPMPPPYPPIPRFLWEISPFKPFEKKE